MAKVGQPQLVPNPQMVVAYAAAMHGGGATRQGWPNGTNLEPSQLGAPSASMSAMQRFRAWLGISIMGADGARVLFPPQNPLQPIAQGPDQWAVGRPWDYPVGYNTRTLPRGNMPVTFQMLKNLAVSYDVIAIIIQRVKDKVLTQEWTIAPKDKKKKPDARCDMLMDFFESPDKERGFHDWVKILLDQAIVYDAPAIWLQSTLGGKLYAAKILDGSMITPKIGPDGRIPDPQYGPGYQQVIKGLPGVDYIKPMPFGMAPPKDPNGFPFPELLYRPKNPRIDSLYGYGPIEQLIATINIALGREQFLLSYYQSGSTPDLIMQCPPTWSASQIAQFQMTWDARLKGLPDARSGGAMFVPAGVEPFNTKAGALTDETDQWLIRITCFCFGLNPMPFIKQMNKGQEKTHHDESQEEGLGPWLHFISSTVNNIIRLKFGFTDIGFAWKEAEETDEVARAAIEVSQVNAKIYHPDEIRQRRGDEPMAPEMRAQMDLATFSATPNATVLPDDQQQDELDRQIQVNQSKPAPVVGAPGAPSGAIGAPGGAADKLGKARGRSRHLNEAVRPY